MALAAAIKCLGSQGTQAEAGTCAVGQGRHCYPTSQANRFPATNVEPPLTIPGSDGSLLVSLTNGVGTNIS